MPNSKYAFVKNMKISLIVYAAILVATIILGVIWGVNLDINFKGGSRFTYTYTGELSVADAEKAIEEAIDKDVKVSQSTSISGDSTKLVVELVADESLSTDAQQEITDTLAEKFEENQVELGETTTVSPTVAGSFFAKSLFAIFIAAVLVVIYVGIRFRKIGGVSAALTALAALVLDVFIVFATCIIFRLQIDTNFMAVILTILGYSLNDTIVIYDRIRENRRSYPAEALADVVDVSIWQVLRRTIFTTVTTFMAVITIVVVAEFFGLTALRTFAIPMAFGILSGSVSSICVSGPLWVRWCNFKAEHAKKK